MTAFRASVQTLAALWRPLTDAELVSAQAWLDAAAVVLTGQFPALARRLDDGTLAAATVEHVQVQMVLRVLRNPGGHRQESTTTGPFSESWTVDSALSSGALYVADHEAALLSPPQPAIAGSIRLGHWS